MITLTGATLRPEQLAQFVAGDPIVIDAAARERAAQSRRTLLAVLARRPVYGRTTGVGANNSVAIAAGDRAGLRLLRSHAGGAGPLIAASPARAALVVRANQLLAGGSGVDPDLIEALVAAANSGAHPQLHEFGSIGTGDLSALAELALTLIGERAWVGTGPAPVVIDDLDALALLSSSAVTLAQAALASVELAMLADIAMVVAALTFVALGGSPEPFAAAVAQARPHPGSQLVAARMHELIEAAGAGGAEISRSGRIQDPYGLRALAPVHGVLLESLDQLGAVLAIELNAAGENPLVAADDVFHNGNFHQAPLAATLDAARLALLSSAQLGAARLGALTEPRLTGLSAFLADGPPGSSGVMIVEYTVASALAALRADAVPVVGGNAVLSRGVEEHASFAPQGVRQLTAAIAAYRVVLAGELVVAMRALRLLGRTPASPSLRRAYERAAVLPTETVDRSLAGDLEVADALLDTLARGSDQ